MKEVPDIIINIKTNNVRRASGGGPPTGPLGGRDFSADLLDLKSLMNLLFVQASVWFTHSD